MIYASEPQYDLSKPPILIAQRQEPFVCVECHKPGRGPRGMRVHPGRCRAAHSKKITERSIARRKRRQRRQRLLAQQEIAA